MGRQFTPTNNIFLPIHFRNWLTGGVPGGGQYSWSDFHDVSPREMAHLKDADGQPLNLMSRNEALSKPGVGSKRDREREATPAFEAAYVEAKARVAARGGV